jgi:uncharacterized protein
MKPIKTLFVTGRHIHDWKRTTAFYWYLMENTGRFEVTVSTEADRDLASGEAAKGYELIVDDYRGEHWSLPARAAFANFVREGGGLVLVHAACVAFPGWAEFEAMAPLTWRKNGTHSLYHRFPVKVADVIHPITNGLEAFETIDELYHTMTHHGPEPYHVLATGHATAANKGTGKDEPVLLISRYGKGRVYQQMLGHVWRRNPSAPLTDDQTMVAVDNPFVRTTFLRGCEWAATGAVTIDRG